MTKPVAVLISAFNYYEIRIRYVEEFLVNIGYSVIYITSNFDHISKTQFVISRPGVIQVRARPYKRNLSASRMISHLFWSRKVYHELCRIKPVLIFAELPPNSLARYVIKYSERQRTQVIFDICDLWPETYPFPHINLMKIPFHFWRQMRDKYLTHADFVVTECDMYQGAIGKESLKHKIETLYPALPEHDISGTIQWDDQKVHLAYLGSINNIIDISQIKELVRHILVYKPVYVHIIGRGESKVRFISELKSVGSEVIDYGPIYDTDEKQKVFSQCRFGINVMRDTVMVSLTLKSIDYFRAGLPIISNIPGDTMQLIVDNDIGFHLDSLKVAEVASMIAFTTFQEHIERRQRVLQAYVTNFSPQAAHKGLRKIFDRLPSLWR